MGFWHGLRWITHHHNGRFLKTSVIQTCVRRRREARKCGTVPMPWRSGSGEQPPPRAAGGRPFIRDPSPMTEGLTEGKHHVFKLGKQTVFYARDISRL